MIWDLLAVAGVLLITAGLAWTWPPASLLFLGLALLVLGILGAKRWQEF